MKQIDDLLNPSRRALCKALAVAPAAGLLTSPFSAVAQNSYPTRPVRFILPFAAGGVADVTSRIVAEKLGDKLGQRFVVENMPGAGGISAARAVMSAPADGYTLALFSNGTAVSVSLFNKLPFDPFKDFAPVSTIGQFEALFVTNAESQFRTLGDFLKAAREKPGTLNVGTISVGSTQHLAAELFKSTTGVNFVIVPFRTSPEVVVSLLRNDIHMLIDFPPALGASLSDGKLRAVASSGAKRSQSFPNVPTAQEAGVPGYEVTSWNAMYVPAGTPKDVVQTLNWGLREVLADPDVKKRALDLGIEATYCTPEEMTARMRADIEKWGKVIEKAGIPKQ